MRLSDLREDQKVSLLGKAVYALFSKGASIFLDFKYKSDEASTGYWPVTDCHGHVSKVEKHSEHEYTVTYTEYGRDEDTIEPYVKFEINDSMDDLLTVTRDKKYPDDSPQYHVVRINPLKEESSDPQPTLLWLAIKHALKNDSAFIEIDVPRPQWSKLCPTYKTNYSKRGGRFKAQVTGVLRGNRIATTNPVLQLLITPEMDDELEFLKVYQDEESYMIRPL